MKTVRLIIVLVSLGFFIGTFWYLLSHYNSMRKTTYTHEVFIQEYDFDSKPNSANMIALTYFVFTTFSTVGLGDFHPKDSFERMFCSFLMLFGVMITSYLVESFSEMVAELRNFNKDHEESEKLNMFFGTLEKYNEGKPLPEKFTQGLDTYFKFKWKKDKFLFLKTPLDEQLLG
mmetsp:Transcript_29534/g.44952  ORF Transcript_29534/g.44952 Transcript_29534/m.44952 type:complete len:174 (+) Transcript_29534:1407-1928(+)